MRERNYYKQLEERKRVMLTDLGNHITGKASLQKTVLKNVAKKGLRVPDPDQFALVLQDVKNPLLTTETGGLLSRSGGRISPLWQGWQYCAFPN